MVKAQEQETETETETEGGFRFLSLFVFLLWGLDLNAFYIWFCQLVRSLSSYMGPNLNSILSTALTAFSFIFQK